MFISFQYGSQLKENYDNLLRDIAEEDLENLANARSFSISSMAKHANNPPNTNNYNSKMTDKVLDLDQVDIYFFEIIATKVVYSF